MLNIGLQQFETPAEQIGSAFGNLKSNRRNVDRRNTRGRRHAAMKKVITPMQITAADDSFSTNPASEFVRYRVQHRYLYVSK